MKRPVLLLGLLASLALAGCTTHRLAGHEESGALGFSEGTITAETLGHNPLSARAVVTRLSSQIYTLVESDLGFVDFHGDVQSVPGYRGRSSVGLEAVVMDAEIAIDLVIQLPGAAGYEITNNNSSGAEVAPLSFEPVTGTIDEEGGRLSAGAYRVHGRYKRHDSGTLKVAWKLELDRGFDLPGEP